MWALWISVALAGNRWEGVAGDVEVTAELALTPEQVTAAFADVPRASKLFEETCARDWTRDEFGEPALVWTPSWMNRKLSVKVDESRPGRRVSWDLHGKSDARGFYLVLDVAPRESGSTVKVTTPLDAPGWPVRGVFFQKIRPAWASCYAAALLKLDPSADVRSVTGPVAPKKKG